MRNLERLFKRSDVQITSPFGWRNDPFTGERKFHNGVDYGTKRNKWNQYALADGEVLSCGTDGGGGKFIYIKYPTLGYIALHYHLDSIKVKKGNRVTSDTCVGTTGKTGRATGIHLHFGWFKIAEWAKAHSARKYEDFELYKFPEVVPKIMDPKPTVTPEATYKRGDTVTVTGQLFRDSYGGGPGRMLKKYTGKITYTNIAKGSKPYHIGTLGWVAKESIIPATAVKPTIAIGSPITLNVGTKYWSNSAKALIGIGGYTLTRTRTTTITRVTATGMFNVTGDLGWFNPNKLA